MQNNNNQYAGNKNNKKNNNNNQQYKQYKGPDQNQGHDNQIQKQRSQNNQQQRSESDSNAPGANGGGPPNSGNQVNFGGNNPAGQYGNRNSGNGQYWGGNQQYGNNNNNYNQNYGNNRNYRDRKGGHYQGGGGYHYHHNNGGGGYHNNYFSKYQYDQYPEENQRTIIQDSNEDVSKADQDQKWKHDKYDQVMQETNNQIVDPATSRAQPPVTTQQSQYSHENETSFSSGGQNQEPYQFHGGNYNQKNQQRYNKPYDKKQGYGRGYDQNRFQKPYDQQSDRGRNKKIYNYNTQHDNFQYQPAINSQNYQDYGRKGSGYEDHGPYRERTESFGASDNEYEQPKTEAEPQIEQTQPPINQLLPTPLPSSFLIQGVQSNIQHMLPKQGLQTIIQIIVRLNPKEDIQIHITEDTTAGVSPLNFYDIQYQIEHQLSQHKNRFLKEQNEEEEAETRKKTKHSNEDLVEAFQFYVKRQLQLQNMAKYSKIAENTYQIQQIQIHSLGNLVNQINLQQQLQNQGGLFNFGQQPLPKAEPVENKTITLSDQINFGNQWADNSMFALKSQPFYPSTPSNEDKKDSPLKSSPQQAHNFIQYNAQTVNFVQYMPPSNQPTDKQSKNYNQTNFLRQMQLQQQSQEMH